MARRAPSDNKFVDHIFPPDISSLCFDPYGKQMDPDVKEFTSQVKSWRRPSEWCKNPQLMKDDAAPGDIEQGQLGDCWLLSALGVTAVRPQLLKHLFVKADPKRGEYCLRFYREGRWEEVTIDDRIPCGADGLPVYAHCIDPEEIWVPIIEKALAKMLGTYEALDGGYLEEGVVMLTGGRPEKVTINNWKGKTVFEETSADLWHKLNTYNREGHMMGAAICSGKEMPDKTTGLVAGHAYGVMNVAETSDKKFKLVKLRNPWGSFEWKGKWSDGSKEWTKQYIADMKQTNADDGTFWMELTDFRKYFDKITVCRVFNLRVLSLPSCVATEEDKELFGNTEWHRAKFECEWNDTNAGGILNDATYGQNPHLKVSFAEKGRAFFLISQPALTTQAESRYYRTGIGFALQKGLVEKKGMVRLPNQNPNAALDENVFLQSPVRSRYNSAHLVVSPGQYVIIPFTDLPNRKTKFVFEVYAEKPFEASVLLPDDRAACRGVPPSARYNDGASVVNDMARLQINSPKAISNGGISAPVQRPSSGGPRGVVAAAVSVPAQRPGVAIAVPAQRPVVAQQQQVMVKNAPPPARTRVSVASPQKPAPQSSSSPVVKRGTATTTTTMQKSAKAPVVQRSAPPQQRDDRFMTTSQMFYKK